MFQDSKKPEPWGFAPKVWSSTHGSRLSKLDLDPPLIFLFLLQLRLEQLLVLFHLQLLKEQISAPLSPHSSLLSCVACSQQTHTELFFFTAEDARACLRLRN